ncbi:MAG: alpha/beta hydrolase [Planctomycetes bacterium]|nr:alpha/beta hydrolase [Planctomycetota bacterium]
MTTLDRIVRIGRLRLPGQLQGPTSSRGLVIFAHGSGSSRLSPRNQFVAHCLHQRGISTLLFDLLQETEAVDRRRVFDIALLASRLGDALDWQMQQPDLSRMPTGLFGASTGAAAALVAASDRPSLKAIVSRGGRPDLAHDALARVEVPTLLIVGEFDDDVLALNRKAAEQMHCVREIAVVPGATHLFGEPGTLETAAQLASDWFTKYLL